MTKNTGLYKIKVPYYFNLEEDMDINEKLVHGLLDINHMMRMLYEGKASQSRVLIVLYEHKSMTQRDLTEFLGIKPGSVSEILAKLERAELITRIHSEKDRRTMEITLTDEGEKLAKEAFEKRRERHKQMFACLTEDEQNTLLLLLETLSEDWSERFSLSDNRVSHNKNIHKVESREK